jgi:hypothetical protein
MTTDDKTDYEPLPPNLVIRQGSEDERRYLGFGRTKRDEEIKNGNLEKPFPLDESGRAQIWYGYQFNRYHQKVRANRDQWMRQRREIAARETARLAQAAEKKATKQRKARRGQR